MSFVASVRRRVVRPKIAKRSQFQARKKSRNEPNFEYSAVFSKSYARATTRE
jgi:hypothetical protein